MNRYPIVTLCGSTKFKNEFITVQKKLTLQGNIVISLGLFGHSGDSEGLSKDTEEMLREIHREKIDMCDEIYVINKNGYIGENTKNEIEYAIKKGKKVRYYEQYSLFKRQDSAYLFLVIYIKSNPVDKEQIPKNNKSLYS